MCLSRARHSPMPSGIVFLVEFLLDVRSNIFFNVVFLQRLGGDIN